MQIFVDTDTDTILSADDVKARLMQPVEINGRSVVRTVSDVGGIDDETLIAVSVARIDFIEVAPPEVEPPYQLQEAEPDKSVSGTWTQQWEVVAPTLEAAQSYAMGRLNRDFDASLPPVDYDGKTWRPGHSSAAVIRDAAEMAELLGLTEVTLTDIDNGEHVYTLANARLVGASIGVAYQQAFLARAAKRRAIADAETPEEALAVTWDDLS